MDLYYGVSRNDSQCVYSSAACTLDDAESTHGSTIAAVRLVVSLLSVLGTLTIIYSALKHRQVTSPKVHPIFMMSVADLLLAVLWVVGGGLWLWGPSSRVGCFAVSLLTVILECVSINLTFVYAVFAHAYIKHLNINRLLVNVSLSSDHILRPAKSILIYIIAWLLPVVITIIPFAAIAGDTGMLKTTDNCSCWCLPEFANVLPYALPVDKPRLNFMMSIHQLILTFCAIVATHYVVVFVLLVVAYVRILRHIKSLRIHERCRANNSYSTTTTEPLLSRGHAKARLRVMLFLVVFIVTGFFRGLPGSAIVKMPSNIVLSYAAKVAHLILAFTIFVHVSILFGQKHISGTLFGNQSGLQTSIFGFITVQSVTVPLQGFLNAIVYGWTREDFVSIMSPGDGGVVAGGLVGGGDGYLDSTDRSDINDSLPWEQDRKTVQRGAGQKWSGQSTSPLLSSSSNRFSPRHFPGTM